MMFGDAGSLRGCVGGTSANGSRAQGHFRDSRNVQMHRTSSKYISHLFTTLNKAKWF